VKEFLDNQIDFSLVRQQAMERVYKQELIDQQNAEKLKAKLNAKKSTSNNNIASKSLIKI
jgi:hypothetical protein